MSVKVKVTCVKCKKPIIAFSDSVEKEIIERAPEPHHNSCHLEHCDEYSCIMLKRPKQNQAQDVGLIKED